MKKMGWKEGKGLGKNQDGIQEPLEVEKRKDNSGIGFKNDQKSFNSFKDNGHREQRRRDRPLNERELQQLREEYKAQDDARKELEKQEEEKRKQESLKMENFPELVLNKKDNNLIQEQNYLEKLMKVHIIEEDNEYEDEDQYFNNPKPGWTLIKKDNLTGNVVVKGKDDIMKESEISEEDIAMKVINSLSDLHEKRTEEYIELNGYDNWEKMFKFQDWREWEAKYEDESDYEDEDEDEDDAEDDNEYIEY